MSRGANKPLLHWPIHTAKPDAITLSPFFWKGTNRSGVDLPLSQTRVPQPSSLSIHSTSGACRLTGFLLFYFFTPFLCRERRSLQGQRVAQNGTAIVHGATSGSPAQSKEQGPQGTALVTLRTLKCARYIVQLNADPGNRAGILNVIP